MQDILGKSLKNLKWIRTQKNRLSAILLVLSIIVTLNVFWALRQPGLTLAGDAACGILDHSHSEECFTRTLICDQPEEAHIHGEGCYTTRITEAQEQQTLICHRTEDPHVHGEGCYTTQLFQSEDTLQLICGMSTGPHNHEDSCYEVQITQPQEIVQVICTETDELHQHTDGCYQTQVIPGEEIRQLICTQPEEPHVHTDSCYETLSPEPTQQTVLSCQLQTVPHEHKQECYTLEVTEATEVRELTCSLSETAHIHEESCYTSQLHCQLEEHVHIIECYSDETADAETLLDWQNMFAAYPYTGDLRQDLVGIAKTQVGYCESTRNFEIGSDGIRRGYTRYGAWYGTPYRDWSAAFVSFCLNYAGADPAQTPGNIGANTMAQLWKSQNRFAPLGEYVPAAGDLVFFTDNTVAIVSEVESTTFYMIRGDVGNAVGTASLLLNNPSIAGWGITVVAAPEPAPDPTDETVPNPDEGSEESTVSMPTWEQMLDISNGPVFFIFANGESAPQPQTYAFRSPRTATPLLDYLVGNGGTLDIKFMTSDDTLIQPDEDNHYYLDPAVKYKLHMRINSPNGLLPGVYQYQLPQGVVVEAGDGTLSITNVQTGQTFDVGTWQLSADGLITLNFNNNMVNQSGISIPATIGIKFTAQEQPIYFDGNITVTVNPPPSTNDPTVLQKWGSQGVAGDKDGKTDGSKIYWTAEITGHQDSLIPGNVLTDRVVNGEWYGTHRYTESDIAAGLRFDVCDPSSGNWYRWIVHQGDPGLQWTESGWSYTVPETVTCQDGNELTLGSNGWKYNVNYTTTPDPSGTAGYLTYTNNVSIDGQSFDGYVRFQHGSVAGEVQKTGRFHADANGGSFRWEITTVIPGHTPGQTANFWYLTDDMSLIDPSGNTLSAIANDADKATATAMYNGSTLPVPHISIATPNDTFAWYVSWSANSNGIEYGRTINFLHRCDCTAENCVWWGTNGCGSFPWISPTEQAEHFCQCWTANDVTTINLTYQTTDLSIIQNYGGVENKLSNYVSLNYIVNGDTDNPYFVDDGWVGITIPSLFRKELTKAFDGYVAHYQITVNEGKLSLTDGSPLQIHDVMTDTLAFINGSLVIRTEDANGTTATLQQGTDYTFAYNGSGTVTDSNGNTVHVLDITIAHPQPVKYIIDYDATLIPPKGGPADVTYSNSASITLWGKEFKEDTPDKTYTKFGITGESYKVELHKTDAETGNRLSGALFGLYNAQNRQITVGETTQTENLAFETNVIHGIIFRHHELYYLKELQAPAGYQLDGTPHWFYFCNSTDEETCEGCAAVPAEYQATRIPQDQIRVITVANNPISYHLPATGGSGTYLLTLVSIMLISVPLVYAFLPKRRKEEAWHLIPRNAPDKPSQTHQKGYITMKKFVSILLALAMILALSIPAFAAENTSLTINNSTGKTFSGYQLLTLSTSLKCEEAHTHEEGCYNYAYTVNNKYKTVLQNLAGSSDILTFLTGKTSDSNGSYGTLRETADDIYRAILAGNIPADKTDLTGTTTIDQGYWLFAEDNAVNSLVIVNTKGQNALTITPKVGLPTLEKKVQDVNDTTGVTSGWQDSADYDIGDTVPFQLTMTMPENLAGYNTYTVVIHDTLDAGLTLDADSIVVKADGTAVSGFTYAAGIGGQFTITCTDVTNIPNVTKDTVFVITYDATLNDGATIGAAGNSNTAYLEYSNNPYGTDTGTTTPDEVTVFTYQLTINKVDADEEPLQGAGFTLYKKAADGSYIPVDEITEGTGENSNVYEWIGLDDGDYKLAETTVPPGYNKLEDIEFTIGASHDTTSDNPQLTALTSTFGNVKTDDNGALTGVIEDKIINLTGTVLPETGAMGTVMLITISTMFVMVAAVFMITRKKMSIYED